MTRRVLFLISAALLVLSLGLAACGGDDDDEGAGAATTEETTTGGGGGGGGGGTTLALAADPDGALAFDKTSLEASSGEVTIDLTNDSSTPHNVEVEGMGVEEVSDTITGSTTSLTVTLEPGTYEFYCAVPGHREAGMEGTLTVQ
ncbi:MAG TPA: plastocyanin/azurin family copper-binding protein [Gaiellaceae bacterium]|jgi:plastocyanin|nr:plastocyanin/azurin family copper-binding protein [Gaiellaceae bacterium]